ncbi:dihydrolipoyllysine-residue acetyltransferase component 4 of pyruvate dehydrogenase complex, chloroplastic [Fagus crenata]
MPALSSTMTEGKMISWIKSEGDKLSKGKSVVVVESDKADMDVETFYDGILAAIVVPEGESAPVSAPIGLLAETEDEIAEAKAKANSSSSTPKAITPTSPPPTSNPVPAISQPPPSPSPSPSPILDSPKKTVATPFAKKLAKQHKVNIEMVVGTGPFGRITPADIESACFVFRLFLSQSQHVLFFFSLFYSRMCGLDKEEIMVTSFTWLLSLTEKLKVV